MTIDRDTASRLGLTAQAVDSALYMRFGQRQVSTMYKSINQYHVVLALAAEMVGEPRVAEQDLCPHAARCIDVSRFRRSPHFSQGITPLSLPHQGQFPATTISFNLAGRRLAERCRGRRSTSRNRDGSADHRHRVNSPAPRRLIKDSLNNQPILILTALLAVYIVLGILYESLIHPLTILSTLPSAGVGALMRWFCSGRNSLSSP